MSGCDSEDIEPDDLTREGLFEVSNVEVVGSRLRFQAGPSAVELELIPNTDLLASGAVVVRDGVELTPREAGLELPYRGYVVGDPGSWIRVTRTAAGFEGLIFTNDNLWEVREADSGAAWMSFSAVDDYLTNPQHEQHTCATSDAEAAYPTDVAAPSQAALNECMEISIAVVADYTHVAKLGGAAASESEMVARINEVDGIYRDDINRGFSVEEIRSFSSSGGPSFNVANAGNTPLAPFGDYKNTQLPNFGLAHLFVARSTSGAVGQAYIGAACSKSKGAGVSNHLGKGKASTIVVAHEIGHNFGAKHDAEDAPYIMAPSVNTQADSFSNASKNSIDAYVNSVSCFVPCEADQPDPEPEDPQDPQDPEVPEQPDGPTCAGSCGGESPDGCWCDDLCTGYGDCCDDYPDVCGEDEPEPEPEGGSCEDECGGESDGCWCDDQCEQYGDCCDDYESVCQ